MMCVFEGAKKLCEVRSALPHQTPPSIDRNINKIIRSTPVFFLFSYKI